MFYPCLCSYPLGTLVSSQIPKMCMLGELACLNDPSLSVDVCDSPYTGRLSVQGAFSPGPLNRSEKLWPPEALDWNKHVRK